MSIEAWWPRLSPESQQWLIEHNGEAVPSDLFDEIVRVGGAVTSDAWWVGHVERTGFSLSDAGSDWVETIANGETPEPPVMPSGGTS